MSRADTDAPTEGPNDSGPTFRRVLTFFDVTNITVGAIIGADIYVAASVTAGLLGPASLLAWLAAGVLATVLALTLGECARLVPEVGGPYAYVARAFGRMPGFLAGWSMWIAELTALPVFAIAFTNYLGYFVELDQTRTHIIRLVFLLVLTATNVVSIRAAGRLNDALTALKLAPLVALVLGGLTYAVFHAPEVVERMTPFAPFGFGQFPLALVLIIWAYMGFELSTVPAGEVERPAQTIPRALATGMAIVTVFYLTTNLVVYMLIGAEELAGHPTPLVAAATVVFGVPGAILIAAGAMISVCGSDESDMIGSSRLGFAMAADGLLPRPFARLHPRFRTPYTALIAQCLIAMVLTFVDAIPRLISFAVVNLSFTFLLCSLALIRLQRQGAERAPLPQRVLPFVGAAITIALLAATSTTEKLAGLTVLAIGIGVHFATTPGDVVPEARALLLDSERLFYRLAHQRMRFLGGPVGWLRGHQSPRARPRGGRGSRRRF